MLSCIVRAMGFSCSGPLRLWQLKFNVAALVIQLIPLCYSSDVDIADMQRTRVVESQGLPPRYQMKALESRQLEGT